jgi:hypothetical protein
MNDVGSQHDAIVYSRNSLCHASCFVGRFLTMSFNNCC